MTSRAGRDSFLGEGLGRCGGEDHFQRQVGDGTPVNKVGEGEDEGDTESCSYGQGMGRPMAVLGPHPSPTIIPQRDSTLLGEFI